MAFISVFAMSASIRVRYCRDSQERLQSLQYRTLIEADMAKTEINAISLIRKLRYLPSLGIQVTDDAVHFRWILRYHPDQPAGFPVQSCLSTIGQMAFNLGQQI